MGEQEKTVWMARWWPLLLVAALTALGLGLWLHPLLTIQIAIGLFGAALVTKISILTYRDIKKKYVKKPAPTTVQAPQFATFPVLGNQSPDDPDRPACFRPPG